jgi:adenine-specific DNA-methyltransferase
LNTDEIELLHRLRKNSKVTPLGKFIDVDVGVVTGCNDFFILRQSEYSKWRLNGSSLPIVSRSPHLKGLFFSKTDLENNYLSDYPALLFFPKAQSKGDLSNCDLRYISFGEENNYQSGYKCSIRDPWYIVPSVWIPDAFSLRQVHEYPKLVLNSSGATCTDTIHRIRFKDAHQSTAIVVSFLNSMTLAFSEVLGRSYGGGVLTFEPSEIEELPIFLPAKLKLNANNIDNLLRDRSIGSVLDSVDNEILINGLGLQSDTVLSLRNIWQKLKERRIGRK